MRDLITVLIGIIATAALVFSVGALPFLILVAPILDKVMP